MPLKPSLRKLYILCFFCGTCFLSGVYFWRVRNSGKPTFLKVEGIPSPPFFEEDALAQVGEEFVSAADLEFESALLAKNVGLDYASFQKKEAESDLKNKVLSAVIERRLLYKQVLKDSAFRADLSERRASCLKIWEHGKAANSFSAADNERLKMRICEQSLIEQYCRERVFNRAQLREDEIGQYYHSHLEEFKVAEHIKVRQIVVPTESDARWIRSRLSGKNFSQMAKDYSIGPEAEHGGVLAPFGPGDLPQVFESAFSLPLGEPSGIIKSTYGFHIFIVDERSGPKVRPLKDVRDHIANKLLQEKRSELYREWADSAIRSTHVRIIRSF